MQVDHFCGAGVSVEKLAPSKFIPACLTATSGKEIEFVRCDLTSSIMNRPALLKSGGMF